MYDLDTSILSGGENALSLFKVLTFRLIYFYLFILLIVLSRVSCSKVIFYHTALSFFSKKCFLCLFSTFCPVAPACFAIKAIEIVNAVAFID